MHLTASIYLSIYLSIVYVLYRNNALPLVCGVAEMAKAMQGAGGRAGLCIYSMCVWAVPTYRVYTVDCIPQISS